MKDTRPISKIPEDHKNKVRRLYDYLAEWKETIKYTSKGKPIVVSRPTVKWLAEYSGLGFNTCLRIMDGSSYHWEWLRAEGRLPRPWILRSRKYGTVAHLRKTALNEFNWRFKNKAISKKEQRRLKLELSKSLRPLISQDTETEGYRKVLAMAYVSIKPWSTELLANGQERIKTKRGK